MQSRISQIDIEDLRQMVGSCCSMRSLLRRLGYKSNGDNNGTVQRYLAEHHIDYSHFTGLADSKKVRTPENTFIYDGDATQAVVRRMYLRGEYTPYICAVCGMQPEWNGRPLNLRLDHIDGDNHNHQLHNLRWICPNCDSQLPTFAGRNISIKRSPKPHLCEICGEAISRNAKFCVSCARQQRVSKSNRKPDKLALCDTLRAHQGNMTAVGRQYGVSDNAVRKWCRTYGLSTKRIDWMV